MRQLNEYITGAVCAWLLILAILIAIWASQPAQAHSWYDSWCCNTTDCAEATVSILPDGRIKATTKHGTAIFRPDQIRPSKDHQWHACILKFAADQARCIYAPTGM